MKIIHLKAENIKRLIAVEITPDSNVVKITGKNGHGKTSVLDAIWWGLGGAQNIQAKPIHTGADEGYVEIDLGEMIVTRTFKMKGDETTSSLKVESKDGSRFPSPQALLDKLLGDLTFDPLAFARMDAKKQFETLRKLVPGVDFEAIDRANKADYDARTDVNRQIKAVEGQLDAITGCLRGDPIDVSGILGQMQDAAAHNADTEKRRANRDGLKRREKELRDQAQAMINEANEISQKILTAGDLPALIDISKLREDISKAEVHNKGVEARIRKEKLDKEIIALSDQSDKLTAAIETRNAEKQEAIAKANIPVEGITFGDAEIILNGQPFNQASDAEQLRASLAIAMALNPKLKVIRVRDGSLLDDNSMKIVEQMAEKNDFQIWAEIVDGSGKVGFVIEDGKNKTQEQEEF